MYKHLNKVKHAIYTEIHNYGPNYLQNCNNVFAISVMVEKYIIGQ